MRERHVSLDYLPSDPPPHSNTSREKRARPTVLARMTFAFSIIHDQNVYYEAHRSVQDT